ncbi:MAG: phosphoglycerate mutase family protein [Luminiphilus sp.]|nr:phosphoglycerate mutase family protein [Luminiphilus sp.]
MTDIWIVRHGEAAASWEADPDPALSELGRSQAETTSLALLECLPNHVSIISSPLRRAQETAEALATKMQKHVAIDSRFSEVRSPVPLSKRKDWLRNFMQQDWTQQSEDLWDWRNDIVAGLTACQGPTVVFCHFLVINAVVAQVSGSNKVLQCWPANASFHHFALESGELSLLKLGEQMDSAVN